MKSIEQLLQGTDRRSIGNSNTVAKAIDSQPAFDELFELLFHKDRILVMRAADAIEKVTLNSPNYLAPHKNALIELSSKASDIELKWHLAQLLPRLSLERKEQNQVWKLLRTWAADSKESKIVRVNALQALSDLCTAHPERIREFSALLTNISHENIPSLNARIRKFSKLL